MTIATQSEFAKLLGMDKSHVTRLKQAGRLVMVEGKVDVEASQARINATANPSYASKTPSESNLQGEVMGEAQQSRSADFNEARARNEMAKAEMSEMERDKMRGSLVNAEQVRLFAADLGATFRASLEILPDRIASELVVLNDVDSVRAVLVESFEQLLHDLSMKIEAGAQS